jgi:Na+/melibiose symporter-like transporter
MAVIRNPAIGPLILIYFLAIFAFANFEATLALFTGSAFGMTEEDNFLVFAYVGFTLLFAGGLYRPLVKKRPERLLLTFGIGLLLLGMGGLAVVAFGVHAITVVNPATFKTLFYFAMTLAVIGFAFVNPSVSAMVSKRADPERQGEVIGVNQGCASLARIAGPLIGSLAFYKHPSRMAPYAIAALTLLGIIALLPSLKRKV